MMGGMIRALKYCVPLLVVLTVSACGGGSDSPSSSSGSASTGSSGSGTTPLTNTVAVVVDGGPAASSNNVNTLYTTVTLCVPGSTTECQTIDHVQVDTGSYGLRVLGSVLTLALPVTAAPDGNSLAECTLFVDGYSWGPVASADLQINGERASSLPIQVIGASSFAAVPAACSNSGTHKSEDTVAQFGANGIIGIGVFKQDCGDCTTNAADGYYSCTTAGSCVQSVAPLASQVANPVPYFSTDNNGTIIQLPAVSSPGAATLTGTMIFGIDTQTNNQSGTQTVLTVDPSRGYLTANFNNQTLDQSFIDSGTNGIFFNDNQLPVCTDQGYSDFYCPASTQGLSVTLTGANGVSGALSFQVDNAETVASSDPTFTVLPSLGGTYPSSTTTFDFGLPFYYGRSVATAIEGYTTAAATGPYVAYSAD